MGDELMDLFCGGAADMASASLHDRATAPALAATAQLNRGAGAFITTA